MIRTLLVSAALLGAPAFAQTAQLPLTSSALHADAIAVDEAIATLEAHGLDPADYREGDPEARWTRAALHLLHGKLDPKTVEPDWTAKRRERDLGDIYDRHLADGTLATSLGELAPAYPEYAALKAELARLRTLQETPRMDRARPTLRPGDRSDAIASVQAQLQLPGISTYDPATVEAVKAFQTASDLDSDGIIGPATWRALDRAADVRARIDQVRVNMERWRWLPDDLGRRHLRANIAGFKVTAYRDSVPERTHLAIVGKPFRKTPVFSDQVDYIVLNPWWETPYNLARLDKLPLFKRDPVAVERLGFQVLSGNELVTNVDWNAIPDATMPYRIRQAPGPANALGQVKIMFPNPHNVYLHDTPVRGLFAQRQRAFSSGCIRTQDPLALSAWLLEDTPGWDAARIDAAIATGKETRVNLKAPVPVHILYFTTEVDAGGVRYLDDVYERDAKVLEGLNERRS